MIQIYPYVRFAGNCQAAMTHYHSILGGELTIQIVGESPMADQWPAAMQNAVLHASLIGEGFTLLSSDLVQGEPVPGNMIALSIQCNDKDRFRRIFDQLSEGGKVIQPLHAFFAGSMGVTIDRFGKEWMFYSEQS